MPPPSPPPHTAWWQRPGLVLLALALLLAVALSPLPGLAREYGTFFLLGICGAVFANSTGAGGGVVFIPVFRQLGFNDLQSVATSFGIQCFGMTAGAITWWLHFRRTRRTAPDWQGFGALIALCTTCAVPGLWLVYALDLAPPTSLQTLFGGFSLLLGVAVLVFAGRNGGPTRNHRVNRADLLALPPVAFVGGMVTAWLSVGAGEFIAIYLILRRFDVTLSVAVAVITTALCVWSVALEHFAINPHAHWQVLAFAGPGAVVGGILARGLVGWLGAARLKVFSAAGCW